MKRLVKLLIRRWHELLVGHPATSRRYLRLVGALSRRLPNQYLKDVVYNQMALMAWPDVELPPARVELASGCLAWVAPHIGELDFRAHFDTRLGYEREVFDWLASRNYAVVVEIGANVGVYTVFFSSLVGPHGKVLAFEPSVEAFRRLLNNLHMNRVENVQPYNCAIANESGFVQFFEPEGHLTNGSLYRDFASIFSQELKVRTSLALSGESLAGLVPEGRVLLKIDVEGAEEIVLRALKPFISTRRPDIVVEVLAEFQNGLNSIDFLRSLGYEFYNLRPTGAVAQSHFVATDFRDYALIRPTLRD